jgi:putative addiction module CopG family antidote
VTIQLSPAQHKTLSRLLKTGAFTSPEEAVAEGLRLLGERQSAAERELRQLRKDINEGVEQARAGRSAPFDAAAIGRVRAQGRRLLAAERKSQGTRSV